MLAGSLRRSNQATPTKPVGLTESHGKNWSCVSLGGATGIGSDQVLPPSVERATTTCMKLPVQLYIATYKSPECGPSLASAPITGVLGMKASGTLGRG